MDKNRLRGGATKVGRSAIKALGLIHMTTFVTRVTAEGNHLFRVNLLSIYLIFADSGHGSTDCVCSNHIGDGVNLSLHVFGAVL
jgi:hypothetical protein